MCYTLASRCASLAESFLAPRPGKRRFLAQAGLTAVLLVVLTTVGRAAPILYVSAVAADSRIYGIEPGQPDLVIPTGLQQMRGLTLGPDGLLYGGANGGFVTIEAFNPATGSLVRTYNRDLFGNSFDAYDMQFGVDGHLYIASRSSLTQVMKLNVQTGVATPFVTDFATVFGLTFGPDGNLYLSGRDPSTSEGQIRRYDASSGALIDVFATHEDLWLPHGLEFGPDGNLYVADFAEVNQDGGDVMRFNGSTGAFMDVFATTDRLFPYDVKFGPHDGNLYLSTVQGIVRYDGSTGDFLDVYSDPPGTMYYMVFTPVPEPNTAALLLLSLGCCVTKAFAGRKTAA